MTTTCSISRYIPLLKNVYVLCSVPVSQVGLAGLAELRLDEGRTEGNLISSASSLHFAEFDFQHACSSFSYTNVNSRYGFGSDPPLDLIDQKQKGCHACCLQGPVQLVLDAMHYKSASTALASVCNETDFR